MDLPSPKAVVGRRVKNQFKPTRVKDPAKIPVIHGYK